MAVRLIEGGLQSFDPEEDVKTIFRPRRGGGGSGEQARNQRLAEEQARQRQLDAARKEATRQQVLKNQERARREALRLEQIRLDRLRAKLIRERAQNTSRDLKNKAGQKIRQEVLINNRTNERILTITNLETGERNTRSFQKPKSGRGAVRQTGGIIETKTQIKTTLLTKKGKIKISKPITKTIDKKVEEFFFGRVLGVKPGLGTGFRKDPQFSSGEKLSLKFVNVWAGNKFDKLLRNSKAYKRFSNNIDAKVNSNTITKFGKDNILQPLSEDALTFGATSPFFKTTTKLKNEFLLDEIGKLNKQSSREISLGIRKDLKGGGEKIILSSEKTSKNFKIKTITTYTISKVGGKSVIVRGGKGASKLINKKTGKEIGKPIEFTFFGKGKELKGRFITIGKEGEKLIQKLGKAKVGSGQVKILTKDLKVIRSRFGTIFKNIKDLELSLSGRVSQNLAKKIRFDDVKIKGFKEKRLPLSLKKLLLRFKTKAKLFGTKKTVRLDINDMAIIRKFAPKSYNRIITSKKTTASGSGKNVKVNVNTKELGKSFGQVASKEIENLLSGKVVRRIRRSQSVDRILRSTAGKGVVRKSKGVVGVAKKQKPISITKTTTIKKAIARKRKKARARISITKTKQAQSVITKSKIKQVQKIKSKKALRLKAKLKLKTKGKTRLKPSIRLRFKPRPEILLPIPKLKLKKGKIIVKKKGKKSFNVFAKPVKGKKLIRINKRPLSQTDARNLRNFIVDTSLSRQGSIRPGKGKPKKPIIKVPKGFAKRTTRKFRRFKVRKGKRIPLMKGRVIERTRNLLDTRRERNKITLARRIKQLIPKKRITKITTTKKKNVNRVTNARRRQLLINLKKARLVKKRLAQSSKSSTRRQRSAAATRLRRKISIV